MNGVDMFSWTEHRVRLEHRCDSVASPSVDFGLDMFLASHQASNLHVLDPSRHEGQLCAVALHIEVF